MDYTTNYHLPQWVETDRVQMEDFNQMCADIDQGIAEAKDAADAAQETANTAESKAEAVRDAYTPGNKPYVIGHYTGNGYGTQTITLGFRPSIVIISGEIYAKEEIFGMSYTVVATDSNLGLVFGTTESGFTVHVVGDYGPYLNADRQRYRYIAFR